MNNTGKDNEAKIGQQIAEADTKITATSLSATPTSTQQQRLPMLVRIIEPRPPIIKLNSSRIFIRPSKEKTGPTQHQNQQVSKKVYHSRI